jgi:hypothetical protein
VERKSRRLGMYRKKEGKIWPRKGDGGAAKMAGEEMNLIEATEKNCTVRWVRINEGKVMRG